MNFDYKFNDAEYPPIKLEDSLKLVDHCHAVHCCIYCRDETKLFKNYSSSCLISMQLRFDGCLGFAGGVVNNGQSVLEALNREMKEEIHLKKSCYASDNEYLFSNVHPLRKMCLHFYAKEISREDFLEMERNALEAEDYGIETMGVIRVPMFTMQDGYRGLPAFLGNSFAGNAKHQLLNFLVHSKLMSEEEVTKALQNSQKGFHLPVWAK